MRINKSYFFNIISSAIVMLSIFVGTQVIAYTAPCACITYNGTDYYPNNGETFYFCEGTGGSIWAYGRMFQSWDGNTYVGTHIFGWSGTTWNEYFAPRTDGANAAQMGHTYWFYVANVADSSLAGPDKYSSYPYYCKIETVAHSYDGGTVTTPATCTTTGVKTYTCSRCGGSYTETIPKTGHSEKSSWEKDSSGHWKVCSVCGATTTSKSSHTDGNKDGLCDTCSYGMYTIISVPSAVTGLVYNGSTKTGVPSGTGYTITGNTATDAGNYTATCTLKSGYRWTGADSSNKSVSWSIARATGAITLAATSRPINIWG